MKTDIIVKIMLIICLIALCIIAVSKRDREIIQIDPVAERIRQIGRAFPYENQDSKDKRANLIDKVLNDK